MTNRVIRLATRKSPLARFQADLVGRMLVERNNDIAVEFVLIESDGDARPEVEIRSLSGTGAFTAAVDLAVAEDRADISVHSAKDLPSSEPGFDLVLAGVPDRQDVRDVLVGKNLYQLAPGAQVATGAIRRRVQLSFVRPDLGYVELRGNIATRIAKCPENGAVIVAAAALVRLGIPFEEMNVLSISTMLPQVGQGAIALRCRPEDRTTLACVANINDEQAYRAVCAERSFLRRVGGGCDAPVGAYATASPNGHIALEAMIASADGHTILRQQFTGDDPEVVGDTLAATLLSSGGQWLIDVGAAQ